MKKVDETMSLKAQFIMYCMMIAIVPTLILSFFLFINRMDGIRENYIENRVRAISQINENVNRQVEWVNSLLTQLSMEPTVNSVLKRESETANQYDLEYINMTNNIYNIYAYTPISNYIRTLIIRGENGLDFRIGAEGALISIENIENSDWFLERSNNLTMSWGGLTNNYSKYTENVMINPIGWTFFDNISGEQLGYGVMFLEEKVFGNCYKELATYSNDQIYIIKQDGKIIASNQRLEHGQIQEMKAAPGIIQGIMAENNGNVKKNQVYYFTKNIEGIPHLITYIHSTGSRLTTIEILPINELNIQSQNFIITLLGYMFFCLVLCVLLSAYLSEKLTKPIHAIVDYVKDIGKGKFYELTITKSKNEISELGRNINKMQNSIQALMNKNVENEQEKRMLELEMLQTQINPHFLNNTLYDVKIMASLQGAFGIEKMVDSLARILKYSLIGTNEKTNLGEEINVLKDYIHIQNVRYKGGIQFHYEIENQELESCITPRFILQPIVENSITHGIYCKEGHGKVEMKIYSLDSMLYIEITDNGVGIKEDELDRIKDNLKDEKYIENKKEAGGVGIYNVHRRVRLMFGNDCGLEIESQYNEYTKVRIVMSMHYGADENQGEINAIPGGVYNENTNRG